MDTVSGALHRVPPARLWLANLVNSPFEEDPALAAGTTCYDRNSADGNWPTFAWTKAHRLHDIKELCSACSKINIMALAEGEASVKLRSSFQEIAQTARYCRLCALLAQSFRGISGSEFETGFIYMMGNQDAVDDGPVCMDLRGGMLNVRVPYPDEWRKEPDEPSSWLLGSFRISFGNGTASHAPREVHVPNIAQAEEMTDTSVPGARCLSPSTQPSATDSLVRRLTGEIQRIIRALPCKICSTGCVNLNRQGADSSPIANPPILPYRIIEILSPPGASAPISLRLRTSEGTEYGYYVTLSHRWGGDFTLKTTKTTLADRTQGFRLDDLPRTFRDAVLVAKALNINYIWIDSLCIVQDDHDEWLGQSAKMGFIYMNATFTIAAHVARQCNEGFLWRSQIPAVLHIVPPLGGPPFTLSIPDLDATQLRRRFFESSIMRQAWVLQELTLSPRILHFVENQLLWECEHYAPHVQGGDDLELETSATIFRKSKTTDGIHTSWLKLVERYSVYQMTKTGDKLIAIEGIVNILRQQQGDVRCLDGNQDRYHCGVFQADIERSLLWYNAAAEPFRGIKRHLERAPSWSWASADCALRFLCLELEDQVTRSLMRIKALRHQEYTDPSNSDPHCHLVVEAPVIRVRCGMSAEKGKRLQDTPPHRPWVMVAAWKSWRDRITYAWCIPDEKEGFPGPIAVYGPGEPVPLAFLAVWGRESQGKVVGAWCIMINLVNESPPIYRRVGMAYVRNTVAIEAALALPEVITLA